MDEKLRHKLMGEIIDGIQEGKRPSDNLVYLDAEFRTKRGKKVGTLSVSKALDSLHNDVYFFGDFDLRDAATVKVVSY